jgi:regulator of protease activity HflC (stomatin/prohibitin superfamily)
MLSDLVKGLMDFLGALWPWQIVQEWERGAYYVCGRYKGEVGPGAHLVLPWFMTLLTVPIQPAIVGTPRCDITLADGRSLSFQATAKVRVVDINRALNGVDQYQESTQELLQSVLAEKLAEIDPERLEASRRGRLIASLVGWVSAEAAEFGVEIEAVRFTTFVVQPRTYRLLSDDAPSIAW